MTNNKLFLPTIFLALAVLASFFLYLPGFTGPLLFDDAHVLTNNKRLLISSLDPLQLIRAMESFVAGGRQISMLSFALNIYFLGDSSWWMKCVNTLIHCANGVVLFIVAEKIISQLCETRNLDKKVCCFLPAVATALWLISPINLTSVLYISQRMTLLSSFFILAGILTYIVARGRIEQPARKLLYLPLIIVGFTTLGYLCKENGALLPLFIAIIEITVFRFKSDGRYDKTIVTLFTGTTVVGVLGVCYILFTRYKWLFGGFEFREFSQIERVLTQFRALTFYLSQILAPTTSELSLWHDHFTISTGLFSPVSTFLSAIVLIAMGGLAILSFQRSPLICIGLAWFFVGHAMESTILPLELVHEHRNYLASFGILLILCYAALSAASWLKKFRIGIYAALTAVFLWNSHVLLDRARIWSSEYSFAEHGAKEQPGSAFANYHFARIQLNRFLNGQKEYGELSKTSFLKARALEPDQMVAELALILASENGAFEYDPEWMQTAIDKFPSVAKSAPLQGSIISFLECLDWGVCVNSKKEAQKLFDLFLETNNARFIGYYALYYWKIDYQPEKAEAAFDRSLKGRDVRFWTYYLQYLVEKKKWNLFCEKHPQFETKVKNFEFKNSISALNEISALASYASKCDVHSD